MLEPSPETVKIRRIVERLSDDDLRSKGPKDLRAAVEKLGLDYDAVRERVNNELARARRRKGIRKGQGRRKAAEPYPELSKKEFKKLAATFWDFEKLCARYFKSWPDLENFVKELFVLRDRLGSEEEMMSVIDQRARDNDGLLFLRQEPDARSEGS